MCRAVEELIKEKNEKAFMVGRQEGRQEDRQEGKQEEKVRIVQKLLGLGKFTPEDIAQLAELPLEEVKCLRENMRQ